MDVIICLIYVFFSVLCTVDLNKQDGVSLQIEQVGSDPHCEMTLNSDVKKKINVAAGTKAKLSFLDCPNEDVRLTASKVIGKVFLRVNELKRLGPKKHLILGDYLLVCWLTLHALSHNRVSKSELLLCDRHSTHRPQIGFLPADAPPQLHLEPKHP